MARRPEADGQTVPEVSPPKPAAKAESPQPPIGQLVCDHLDAVYAYAFRLCGEAHRAEEVVQQTFLLAQQRLQQLRQADRARSWLLAIARSCFLKECRKQRPRNESDCQITLADMPRESDVSSQWDEERLQQCLAELPEEFRLVVVMFYFEHASYQQIAEALEVPPGTVMSRLARAKQRLRSALLVDTTRPCSVQKP